MSAAKHLNVSHDQVLDLIAHIYDAGLDPGRWPHALQLLASLFQAQQSTLRVIDPGNKEISRFFYHNRDPYWLSAHNAYFSKIDPWLKLLHERNDTLIECTHHVISDRTYRRMEYYRDYIEPIDAHYGVGGLIGLGSTFKTYFSLKRGFNKGGFTPAHLELVKKLVPHLNKSIIINSRTRQLKLEADTLRNSLSNINSAIVVVNRHGNILFANRSAETLLRGYRGVTFKKQGIELSLPLENKRLQKIIATATTGGSTGIAAAAGGMKYHHPGNDSWLSILVSPLNPDNVDFDLDTTRCALVFLSDNHRDAELNPNIVSEIYTLTESEARIAILLCRGLTLNEISEQLQITLNTVKTHLKSVFQKTDTRRQTELVNLINTGPAGIRHPRQE